MACPTSEPQFKSQDGAECTCAHENTTMRHWRRLGQEGRHAEGPQCGYIFASNWSEHPEEHLQHLEEIFTRLCKFGLKMKREKCSFFKKHIQYLGHLVSERGFEPLPEKLESICKCQHQGRQKK